MRLVSQRGEAPGCVLASLTLAFLLGQWGCALAPKGPPPRPSEEARADLGTIGVVSARFVPRVDFRLPARGAGEGAGRAAANWAKESSIATLQARDPITATLWLFVVVPLGTGVAAVVGATRAGSPAKVDEADTALRRAAAGAVVQEAMQDRILTMARQRTRHPFVFLAEGGPSQPDEASRYPSLATNDVDTVLEIAVPALGLDGPREINPDLRFFMEVRTRLVRVADGSELALHTFRYRSRPHKFDEWAADSARTFREEVGRAYETLADSAVDELFLLHHSLDRAVW